MDEIKKYCKDCGSELYGEFCSQCGQRDVELKIPFKDLAKEFIEEFFSFDARLLKSIYPFLVRPGLLTLEYVAGKRTQYISPFKLYFSMSFLFFFTLAFFDSGNKTNHSLSLEGKDSTIQEINADSIIWLGNKSNITFSADGKNDSVALSKKFGSRFAVGVNKMKTNPQLFFDKLHEHTPHIIFLMLPIFALLLKLMYIRSNVFYIQHIVFTFYFHSFVFFILLFSTLIGHSGIDFMADYSDFLVILIPFYLYTGMRRVYKQSRGKLVTKFLLLGGSYSILLLAAIISAVFILISFL
jgi:hypothetical protein